MEDTKKGGVWRLQAVKAANAFLSRIWGPPDKFPMHLLQAMQQRVKENLDGIREAHAGFFGVESGLGLRVASSSSSCSKSPPPLLACLSQGIQGGVFDEPKHLFDIAMNPEQVSRRLDGVPVYTVSNHNNEFVLISDFNGQKSLGLFCFRQQDAESLLAQVKDREPGLRRGAKVVAVSLDKVYQLKTEGIAFRFLPDPLQVKHALESRAKAGDPGRAFDGVPVFQSDNLILRSNNRRFCPIFFSKEDLEKALTRAFKQQQSLNPSLRVTTDIQVGSFEDVLHRMEWNEEDSGWGDIVFIPPGMDAFSHLTTDTGSKVSAIG